MLVLHNVATSDVLVILPQLGYVQSVLVLHTYMTTAAHTYAIHTHTCAYHLARTHVCTHACTHAWTVLIVEA